MAPMIPIDAASFSSNPRARARSSVPKIPNWPAAPSSIIRGFSRSGPKSVIAPIPTKMRSGNISFSMPIR